MSSEISEIEKEGIDNAQYSLKNQNRMFHMAKEKRTPSILPFVLK
jgi:hypothetical protein